MDRAPGDLAVWPRRLPPRRPRLHPAHRTRVMEHRQLQRRHGNPPWTQVMKEGYPVRVQYAIYFVNGPKSILVCGIHPFPAVLSWSALSYVFHLLIT